MDAVPASHRSMIIPRKIDLNLSSTPKYWAAGEIFRSHLYNALSLFLPGAEKFLIESACYYKDFIKSPNLRIQVEALIRQEALHTSAHKVMNNWIGQNYDLIPNKLSEVVFNKFLENVNNFKDPMFNLAICAVVEHFTEVLSYIHLRDSTFFDGYDSETMKLWRWHAFEELEHKTVLFDLYTEMGGAYSKRIFAMVFMTFNFSYMLGKVVVCLLKLDKKLYNIRMIWDAIRYLFSPRRGIGWKFIYLYFLFYLPWYHPNRIKDEELYASIIKEFDKYVL